MILNNIGHQYTEDGQFEDAAEAFNEAITKAKRIGRTHQLNLLTCNLGEIYLFTDKAAEAEDLLRTGIEGFSKSQTYYAAAFQGSLAMSQAKQGNFDECDTLLNDAERILQETIPLELPRLHAQRGITQHLAGNRAAAEASHQTCMSLMDEERWQDEEGRIGSARYFADELQELLSS